MSGIELLLAGVAALLAQNPPPAPAPAATEPQKLQALVIATDGRAEWKGAGALPWKAAAVNDLLDAGAEIRTGLRSTLTLRVGKNATLVIDRASRVELPVIVQDGTVLRTRAAVHRGKCDFKVEAIGVTSDFQVITPSATLAVRGTGFSVAWGALEGVQIHGFDLNRIRAIEVQYLQTNQQVFLSAGAESSSSHPDPVQAALFRTVFPPPSPAFRVGDGPAGPGGPPRPPPPPFHHHFRHQQQIQHGGSDFGQDTSDPDFGNGPPPSHG